HPKTRFLLKSIKVSELFSMIRNSIDSSRFEIQRTNFEFWDELIKKMWICNKYSLQKKDRINKNCSNF
ncbi:MAG: hypothetical protein WB014_16075, partial [Methanosarcina sp.]